MTEVAAEFIKPNDRLSAFERLQLYNRMYWFRLIDIMHADNPGLRAMVADKRFDRNFVAGLPDEISFTFLHAAQLRRAALRKFVLRAKCAGTAPHTARAHTVARFEWAQTVAFDEGAPGQCLTPVDLAAELPTRLRLGAAAVSDAARAGLRRGRLRDRGEETRCAPHRGEQRRRIRPSRRAAQCRARAAARAGKAVYVAVHRYQNRLFYKRLDRPAFLILQAIAAGRLLAQAVAAGGRAR